MASWVTGIAFSPSGRKLAVSGHNGTVHYMEIVDAENEHSGDVKYEKNNFLDAPTLPFKGLVFSIDEKTIIGAGYDCVPILMELNEKK